LPNSDAYSKLLKRKKGSEVSRFYLAVG